MRSLLPIILVFLVSDSLPASSALDSNKDTLLSSLLSHEPHDIFGSSDDPNDWQEQIYCTIDKSNSAQPLIDEDSCKSRSDASSNPCVWCSFPENPFLEGACVSQSQKEAAGQLCSSLGSSDDVSPSSSADTPHQSVNSCFSITDQAECTAAVDSTAKTDQNCIFCDFPLLGGKCVNNLLGESLAAFCSQGSRDDEEEQNSSLRGGGAGGWAILDTACLGDDSTVNNAEDCSSRTDSNGGTCVWCEAAGVFGECVSAAQKDIVGQYLECTSINVMVE